MQRMAATMAKSGLFGIKDADQALSLMLIAVAEGHSPALVARDFHIIQGRPSKKADAMLRDFQAAGGKVIWHKLDDTIADATFSHPQGGEIRLSWDMARADRAGLTGKDGSMYKKYARAMFRSRVVSEGCRTIWPSSTSGMYTPEEGRDIPEDTGVTTIDRTDAAIEQTARDVSTALTAEEIEQHVDTMNNAATVQELQDAYMAAHEHAKQARDTAAKKRFQAVYDLRSADLKKPAGEVI
jgi:hypothetical protein